jgi:prevent-host-death family protein
MSQYDIAEAKAQLSELLQKAMLGEEVVISENKQPLVRLVPIGRAGATRVPGSARGQIIFIAPDFDDLPADVQDYT